MLRSILVPLDGSAFGEYALATALGIARRAGARIELVHVHEPDPARAEQNRDDPARERAREYLESVAARAAAAAPVPVGYHLIDGGVADALCGIAETLAPDLVVLTTHGRGPLGRLWFGSVTAELVRRLSVPVLLARSRAGPPDFLTEPPLRRILVSLDGSALGEQVIPTVTALGALTGAEYRLLRVVPPVLTGAPFDSRRPDGARAACELMEAEARLYLGALAGRLSNARATETAAAIGWPPAEMILADANANGADLIALATRGCRSLTSLLLGSVADDVVRGATGPVLLVRSGGESQP